MVSASSPSGSAVAVPMSHVDGAGAYLLDEPVGVVLQQRELHAGMCLVEGGEGVEQRREGAAHDHPDREPTADQVGDLVHGLAHGRGRGQRGAGWFEGGLAGGCEGGGAC